MRKIQVLLKKLLSKFICIPSFCKRCGVNIRDFQVEDELWFKIAGKYYQSLCYNCFCDLSKDTYELVPIRDKEAIGQKIKGCRGV